MPAGRAPCRQPCAIPHASSAASPACWAAMTGPRSSAPSLAPCRLSACDARRRSLAERLPDARRLLARRCARRRDRRGSGQRWLSAIGCARAAPPASPSWRWRDPRIPPLLAAIPDPPPVLWMRGAARRARRARPWRSSDRARASPYGAGGRRAAGGAISRRAGVAIVSGLARGVDSAAHRGALAAGGATVAVLGCGRRRIYPGRARALAAAIARDRRARQRAPAGHAAAAASLPAAQPHHQRAGARGRRRRGRREERLAHHRALRARAGPRGHGRARATSWAGATAAPTRCCGTAPGSSRRRTTSRASSAGLRRRRSAADGRGRAPARHGDPSLARSGAGEALRSRRSLTRSRHRRHRRCWPRLFELELARPDPGVGPARARFVRG